MLFELFNPLQRFRFQDGGGPRNCDLADTLYVWNPSVKSRYQLAQFTNGLRPTRLRRCGLRHDRLTVAARGNNQCPVSHMRARSDAVFSKRREQRPNEIHNAANRHA
jgi:hypothetical protein